MGQHPRMLKWGGSSGRWDAALGAGPPERSLPTPRSCGWCGEVTDPRWTQSLRPRGCQAGQAGESWGEKVGSGWASATLGERLHLPRPVSSLATRSYWDLCLDNTHKALHGKQDQLDSGMGRDREEMVPSAHTHRLLAPPRLRVDKPPARGPT